VSSNPPRIDVWAVDLDRWSDLHPEFSSVTAQDRAQADRLRSPGGRRRLLARRSATRAVLAHVLGTLPSEVGIERNCPSCGSHDHGRPSVQGAPVEFSVSASGGLAVVAVSTGPVGVDLEVQRTTGRDSPVTPWGALTATERNRLEALGTDGRTLGLLRLWTAKEALLKASGRSLADNPSTIEMSDLIEGDTVVVVDATGTWTVRQITIDPAVDTRSGRPDGSVEEEKAVVSVADVGGGRLTWRTLTPEVVRPRP
jgi:4'-phosphopantetheinyl transferase